MILLITGYEYQQTMLQESLTPEYFVTTIKLHNFSHFSTLNDRYSKVTTLLQF